MSDVADRALRRLLERAENARARGQSERKVALPFTASTFAPYLNLPTREAKDACHGELMLAQRSGGILISWNRRAGPLNQIDAIDLADGDALAAHLKVKPRWIDVREAGEQLASILDTFPVLRAVLGAWSCGMRPKGTGPKDASDWNLAAQVITRCRASGVVDVPIRRLSTALLFDSKKLEQLTPLIDALLQGDLQLPSRDKEDVHNEIGLIKFPPTLLVAGNVSVLFNDGLASFEVRKPYLGIAPEAIRSVKFMGVPAPLLLTVENLTTFHELARDSLAAQQIIILYTGGMPSPSFKRAYRIFLDAVDRDAPVFHWGDADTGGFRIADHLAQCCVQAERTLHLHEMAPAVMLEERPFRKPLAVAELKSIEKICLRNGWEQELNAMNDCKVAIEQEGLPLSWPKNTIST